ncbi:penicillin-binding protein 2 [Patescibacteria group bacterium]|nr:penicillin-binding protein 2 [Patescibacteria group bacterium]MBU1754985.1 penicillin-binding protein 2 [Patescibacteria group bacterium]
MRQAFRTRLRVIILLVAAVSLLLITRLYFVQVVHGSDYALRAEKQYVSSSQKMYDRGSIYFTRKDGTLISAAALATGFTLAIDPMHLEDAEEAYRQITAAGVEVDYEKYMASAAKKDDPYEVIAKRVPDSVGRVISDLDLPGVVVERERWRTYPASPQASRSVGFVAYDNDNTLAGRIGLERYYNDALTHRSDGLFGNFFAELFANIDSVMVDAREAREGDIVTSIEPVVQEILDQVLLEIQAKYSSRETGGIIMDPATGEIIALEVIPSFDANNFGTEDPENFGNPLVEHTYEFGSIVKALTMAGGIDSGAVDATTIYNDTGCMTLNTKKICNYDLKARGMVPMQEVLSQSLNIGATYVALKTGHDQFREYFKQLGFGTETGVDLPSEVPGNIRNILNSPRDIEYATASFGQGIAVTPMEMVRALGALANHGAIVTPHLVRAVKLESGVTKQLSWGHKEQVYKREAVEEVTRMLVKVVDEKLGGGTVKIPEMSVAAKTGTAQIAGPGGSYYDNLYFHSFFGYFPASDPKFIILLYTREPKNVQYASETLTHPFMDLTHFLINYYAVPPDRADYESTT